MHSGRRGVQDMRVAYFDCFSGAAGDMIVGALLDAGADFAALRDRLSRLPVTGYELSADRVKKQGLAATKFDVAVAAGSHLHRHLKDIVKIIESAGVGKRVQESALRVFGRLAEAEAAVHNCAVEKVHFHEVGAVDAIVDIVGACACIELLGIERVECSPIAVGSGTVRCEHGELPVPAPATANLLRGVPIAACDEKGELATPTGAAILTTLAAAFGPVPAMRVSAIGYGAGTRDGARRPNVLRVLVGETDAAAEADEIIVLETNLDDATGETVGHALDRLLASGALDAFVVPIQMKKGRPGVILTALSAPADAGRLETIIFEETGTFGVRRRTAARTTLSRTVETVDTEYGPIRVKVGSRAGREMVASPEFEDCRTAAAAHQAPLREVMAETMRRWRADRGRRGA